MKNYGFNKATEFTRKQINVVFANAKQGNLKVEKWFMSELYVLADYYGYDDNRSVEWQEREVKDILEAVFSKDYETAQKLIDKTTNDWYNAYGRKTKEKCNRTIFVA